MVAQEEGHANGSEPGLKKRSKGGSEQVAEVRASSWPRCMGLGFPRQFLHGLRASADCQVCNWRRLLARLAAPCGLLWPLQAAKGQELGKAHKATKKDKGKDRGADDAPPAVAAVADAGGGGKKRKKEHAGGGGAAPAVKEEEPALAKEAGKKKKKHKKGDSE